MCLKFGKVLWNKDRNFVVLHIVNVINIVAKGKFTEWEQGDLGPSRRDSELSGCIQET